MRTTTTYAKRHRLQHRREDGIERRSYALDFPETEQRELSSSKNQKRKRPLQNETGIEPAQKKKSSETLDKTTNKMALYPFQTPFPTVQAQSQVFRLPSSSPTHSTGLLSPVPVVLHKPVSTSQNLEQNFFPRNAKSWLHSRSSDLAKTLSSSTLRSSRFSPGTTSGPGRPNNDRYDRSRSTSRSSNSSAVSSTLKDTQGSYTNANLKHSKSLNSLKGNKKFKRQYKHKNEKIRHSTPLKSPSDNLPPLASPFPSPSCSPARSHAEEYQKAHIFVNNLHDPSNQPIDMGPPLVVRSIGKQMNVRNTKARSGLSEIFFDRNLPYKGKGSNYGVQNSPQKEGKRKSALELLAPDKVHQARKHQNFHDKQKLVDRNRRPSAPSRLQAPRTRRHIDLTSLPRRHANNENFSSSASVKNGRIRLGSGLSIALAPSSPLLGPKGSDILENNATKSVSKSPPHKNDPDAAMEWMHARGTIDFNRPPSQMTLRVPFGFEYPDVEASDVFFSSSSSSDDDDVAGIERNHTRGRAPIAGGKEIFRSKSALGFNDPPAIRNFGEDIWGASSPFKNRIRHLGLDVGYKTRQHISTHLNLDRDRRETDLDVNNIRKEEKSQASALTRSASMPNFKNEDHLSRLTSASVRSGSAEGSIVPLCPELCSGEARDAGYEDGEMDMDLTGSEVVGGIHLISEEENEEKKTLANERDWTPWVTDSIISPPTGYLGRVINKGNPQTEAKHTAGVRDEAVREHHRLVQEDESSGSSLSDPHCQRLSSPFELSEKDGDDLTRTHEQLAAQTKIHTTNLALSEPEAIAESLVKDTDLPANTTRTRSGTIVPIRAPIPPGIRRTRGGTIVGPLPGAAPTMALPSVPNGLSGGETDINSRIGPELGRRSRSGTVTAPISAAIPLDGVNASSAGLFMPSEFSASTADTPEEDYDDIECYIDSMYLPPLTSSPDPIDFLRFASIMEEEEEHFGSTEFQQICDEGEEIVWQVAEDPPSPETAKKQGNKIFRGMGLNGKGWSFLSRADRKRKSQKKTKFIGDTLGNDAEDVGKIDRNGDTESSDDELLLHDSGLS